MLSKMTGVQLREWQVFAQLHVLPDERFEYLFATIIQTMCNMMRKKGSKTIKLEDVRLRFGDNPKPKRSWEDMKAVAMAFVKEAKEKEDGSRRRRHRR